MHVSSWRLATKVSSPHYRLRRRRAVFGGGRIGRTGRRRGDRDFAEPLKYQGPAPWGSGCPNPKQMHGGGREAGNMRLSSTPGETRGGGPPLWTLHRYGGVLQVKYQGPHRRVDGLVFLEEDSPWGVREPGSCRRSIRLTEPVLGAALLITWACSGARWIALISAPGVARPANSRSPGPGGQRH